MRRMGLIVVTTTLSNRDDALRLARALVEQRLVACAQVSAIESCYRWDGAVCESPEFRLVLKTRDTLYPALEQAILALHPYELPAIHAVPVCAAHGPYADWVLAETTVPSPDASAPRGA
jgi:periplasmic divalent cation tolerance protein